MLALQNASDETIVAPHLLLKITDNQATQEIKEQLRELWAEVLQDDPENFLDEDVFFDVGGDSVRSQMLIMTAEKRGILLTMEQIFMNPSLEEMASVARVVTVTVQEEVHDDTPKPFALIQSHGHGNLQDTLQAVASQCQISPERIEDMYPCSPMQESLVAQLEGNTNLYVRQFVFRISHDAPLDRFRQAWEDTVRANPVLRTRICDDPSGRGFVQVVVDDLPSWSVYETALSDFLQKDAITAMNPGELFFRYALVADGSQRYFVWTAHHALCDGASIPEILNEVATRYRGQSDIITERAPFQNFIQSVVHSDSPRQQEQDHFWQRSMAELNPTPFPAPPRSDAQMNPSATFEHSLYLEQQQVPFGLTKALLLRAAWAILLSHYTGTQDIVFGAINSGRTADIPGVSQMTGPTINLVPIGLRVDSQQPVASFLSHVRTQSAGMIPFEHMGLARIRQALANGAPTATDFQALLVIHPMEFADAINQAMEALGLEYLDTLGKKEHHPYPLIATCTIATDTTIRLTLQHDERVVSTKQAESLGHQFEAVVKQLTEATTETLLDSISPLSRHDLAQISKWNRITPPVEETCLHHLFGHHVQTRPGAVAVCSIERSLTYAEVDVYSTSLALELLDRGVRPGTFVAVCFGKSIWTVVAILAVFKAGGVYVPIEPAHPRGRISEIISAVSITVALASKGSAGVLDGLCSSIITVDGQDLRAGTLPPRLSKPYSTAYLLFTSGTTGKPKGLLMPHQAICSSIIHHGRAFRAGPHWRTLQFGAHTFDLSIGEFFTTLAFGGCICIPSDEDRLNNLAGAITALAANTLLVVPTVANLLHPHEVPTLKTIVLAGEPITKETIVRWADHVELTAAYGPSETAVYCSGNLRVSSDADPAHIGHAIGATMWIANPDNYHQLCAIGTIGEILISGPLLGGGYIGDPAQTDAAWVPAPKWMKEIGSSQYDVLYRSGDLARYNEDGTFRIVGRRDTQVKLRGYRIELGEIENQIMASGVVAAALAALPKIGPCAKQIVTVLSFNWSDLDDQARTNESKPVHTDRFALASDRDSPETRKRLEQLQRRLALILPEYMVPTVWVVLEKLPLLISGKIDRKAIKAWVDNMSAETFRDILEYQEDGAGNGEITPGSTADTIRGLWSEALVQPPETIQLGTSFFALGGDSIAAIRVVSEGKKLGLPLTVRGIITAKTLGNLAALVEQQLEQDGSLETSGMDIDRSQPSVKDILAPYESHLQSLLSRQSSAAVEDAYYFSSMQREIQRQRRLNPAVFLLSWQMEIASRGSDQTISLERLARAWKQVVQRFSILRSIFLADPNGQLPSVQVVLANAEPEIATVSVSSEVQTEPTFESLNVPPVDECFLPHRALFSQRGDRSFIHIELDHLTIDGWSLRIIKEALLEAYEADRHDRIPPAPSYKDFVHAQTQPARASVDRKHWTSILRGQAPSILFPSSSNITPSPRKTIIYLPEIPATALSSFSVAQGLTPASIFDAAWAQTLSFYTQSRNIGFEYVVSGRDEEIPGVFDMVGPLINVLAYHLDGVTADQTTASDLAQLAHRMQDQRSHDSLHSAVNIREVIGDLHGAKQLFNTAVNFQRRPTAVESGMLWVDDDVRKSVDPWHFDILVRVMHITDDNTFRSSFEFDARLFEEERIKEVARDFWRRVTTTFE
ncbi:uncharacterized protein DSM5745_04535 [Aspergillus mulundensis]|uniref:Carrier domain-containing protein n=1 Tax=Aspergillus mulundensis TaxID=1810919 RepID=A0A3D8SD20_9EURO|nr:Uncharacterized protein DSM5745_04535 [Aspergillus mulundensis]RDW84209.1 Uncharacterized protein DSM5745_04535 [Aspergillus mulundensis]